MTVINPEIGTQIRVRALIDFRCARDLISLALVTWLGIPVQVLPEPIVFMQMGGPPMKEACKYQTVLVVMGMGSHWEQQPFIINPTAKSSVVLGIWLWDHDLYVQWSGEVLHFPNPRCKAHRLNPEWGEAPAPVPEWMCLA